MLRNGILHDAVHRAACGVNPVTARLTASEERSKRGITSRLAKKRRNRAQEDLINKLFCDRMVSTLERHGGIRP